MRDEARRVETARVAASSRALWLLVACTATGFAVVARLIPRAIGEVDFEILYQTAMRARSGIAMYQPYGRQTANAIINYNPPHFHVLVWPLTFLPYRSALMVWTVLMLQAGVWALKIAVETVRPPWTERQWFLFAVVTVFCVGFTATVRLGQVSTIVLLPVAFAWRAARRGDWVLGAAALGLAASLKPFLLFFALWFGWQRRWRAVGAMVVSVAAWIALGGVVYGWDNLGAWVRHVHTSMPWTANIMNASVFGFAARTLPLDVVRPAGLVGAVAITGATLWRTRGSSVDIDRAWLLVTLAALLCSPLGWTYYWWLVLPALVAVLKEGSLPRWTWLLVPLACWPPQENNQWQASVLAAVTIGSLYWWATFGLWLALLWPADRRTEATADIGRASASLPSAVIVTAAGSATG